MAATVTTENGHHTWMRTTAPLTVEQVASRLAGKAWISRVSRRGNRLTVTRVDGSKFRVKVFPGN